MKSLLLLLVLVPSLGVATSAFSMDSYLCIGSKITGFNYNKNAKVYRSTTKESYNIYIIEMHKNAKYMWGVRTPGKNGINYLCNEDFNEFGYLSCESGAFRMYKKNLIFLNSYLEDFFHLMDFNEQLTTETGRNFPYVEIGRCHPL